jgi:hypothetical protein
LRLPRLLEAQEEVVPDRVRDGDELPTLCPERVALCEAFLPVPSLDAVKPPSGCGLRASRRDDEARGRTADDEGRRQRESDHESTHASSFGHRRRRGSSREVYTSGTRGGIRPARGGNLLDAWERLVRSITGSTDDAAGGKLDYSLYDREKYATVHMLHGVLDDERTDRGKDYHKFRAPTSMRDVEAGVHLWIARGRSLGGKT